MLTWVFSVHDCTVAACLADLATCLLADLAYLQSNTTHQCWNSDSHIELGLKFADELRWKLRGVLTLAREFG
jgi:beta-glucanase (GH16 family)